MCGVAPPGKREKARLGRYLAGRTTSTPPALVDGQLLRLFGFRKSLEEIDAMDKARLNRALEALDYGGAWERYHEPKGPLSRKQAARRWQAEQEASDRKKVMELLRLAVAEDSIDGAQSG